ncbi:MAG: DUF523 domain-containing protein [Proteobacteria bacterium]|nr:DUF523 domain-containing protein [Pseudomonadota bacterium]
MNKKVQIAISACLLGEKVRYDAKILPAFDKNSVLKQLNIAEDEVEFISFCPEVGIGLGVPRAKIQVIRNKQQKIRVLGVENHTLDVTTELESYAQNFFKQHPDIFAYLVKSKSPSCGYASTPLFDDSEKHAQQISITSGLFVQTILKIKPQILVIDIKC